MSYLSYYRGFIIKDFKTVHALDHVLFKCVEPGAVLTINPLTTCVITEVVYFKYFLTMFMLLIMCYSMAHVIQSL